MGPRLSSLAVVPLECQLKRVEWSRGFGLEQAIQAPTMHQIGADQSGEDERISTPEQALAEIDYFSRLPDANPEDLRGVTTRARPAWLRLLPVK